jgi:hypothetical protein
MDKTQQIIDVLSKVDDKTDYTLDNAFEELDTFTHYERSFDHQTGCYDEVWEHPRIKAINENNKHPLNSYFFTLYRVKPQFKKDDHSEYFPNFKLILGRVGNTTIYRLD